MPHAPRKGDRERERDSTGEKSETVLKKRNQELRENAFRHKACSLPWSKHKEKMTSGPALAS